MLLASLVYGPALFGVVTDATWLAGVFVLGPAVGLSSVVAGVIVSARVNDPRVAQQIGGMIIVPIIALVLLQATGTLLVGPTGYVLLARSSSTGSVSLSSGLARSGVPDCSIREAILDPLALTPGPARPSATVRRTG